MTRQNHNRKQLYLRWTKIERIQHWVLAITFIILVITGFALKYPDSWWTWPFVYAGQKIDLRGITHRIAATFYLALALFHLWYLIFTERGRAQFNAMRIRWQDAIDLRKQIRFNLNKSTERPKFGHFTYWEKAEYWALIWGTIVMAGTGLTLWFENIALKLLPLWVLDLSTVIHLYEAILASLAILVWHFYFVIFNPEVYPVNFSMFDGHITQHEMEEEHAGELEEILQEMGSRKE